MSRGNSIIVSAEPKGHREECVVSGTPKPGTCMEIVPSTATVSGVFTYRASTINDGAPRGVVVLLEDDFQGTPQTTAYVTGTRGFLYWPVAGEELNMLLRYQPGTGTSLDQNIGDRLEVDGATGKLQGIGSTGPTLTHTSAPFQMLERLAGAALAADALVWTKYLGNCA